MANGTQPQMPPAQMPFTGMMQPEPNQLLSQIQKPAQTPEEVIERKGLWQSIVEKINTDPNLQNAMLMMGANLMQPPGPGQTPAGQVGQALGTGFGVYKAGEYSQYQQEAQAIETARKERETAAGIKQTQATTAATEQATKLAQQLEKSQVEKAGLELEGLRTKLGTAKSEAEVKAIEADLAKRKADIEKTVPDANLRAARLAELDKVSAEVEEARARAKNLEAAGGHYRARSALEQAEVDALQGLSDKEKRAYFTKSGQYASTASSAVVQQGEFWGRIYDALPTEDVEKKGRTREQYMATKLKQAMEKSQIETLTKALQSVSDPELQTQIEEMIRLEVQKMRERGGTSKQGAAAAALGKEKSTLLPGGKYRRIELGPNKFRIEPVEPVTDPNKVGIGGAAP